VEDLGVEEGLGVGFDVPDQTLHQILRLGTGRTDEDRVPAMDAPEDVILRSKLLGTHRTPMVKGHASLLKKQL
jgi:hypothetical protein